MEILFIILIFAVGVFFSVEFFRAIMHIVFGLVEHWSDDTKKGLKILLNAAILFITIILLAKIALT